MKRVSLHTLGCKLNQAETAMLAEEFKQRGYEVIPFGESADVVFINTCTVTGRTDYSSRQALRRSLKVSPQAFVVVGGCYAERAADELSQIKGVDLILGAQTKFQVFDYLNGIKKNVFPKIVISGTAEDICQAPTAGDFGTKTRAFLKIQDGCDARCAYCAVPFARGTSRSSLPADVLSRAQQLAARGFKEIVLTGVHIGKYGQNFSQPLRLEYLLEQLLRDIPQVRFRLSSLEPQEIRENLLELVQSNPRICRHFHVPLQSGSDTILQSMNRSYTTAEYQSKINLIKKYVPEAGIGTDLIVGFPGESQADFEVTCRFVEALPLSYFHVFRYSRRKGTAAAVLRDDVTSPVKVQRSEKLRQLGQIKKRIFTEENVGRPQEVLFERQNSSGVASGLTSNYIRVEAHSAERLTNTIRQVIVEKGPVQDSIQCRLCV